MRARLAAAVGLALAISGAPDVGALAQIPAVPPQDVAAAGAAEPGSGKDLYLKRCAGCHGALVDPVADARAGPSRIPTRAKLEAMPAKHIVEALTFGPMQDMAIGLSDEEMASIAAYLTEKQAPPRAATP